MPLVSIDRAYERSVTDRHVNHLLMQTNLSLYCNRNDSLFERSCRTWNALPNYLRSSTRSVCIQTQSQTLYFSFY